MFGSRLGRLTAALLAIAICAPFVMADDVTVDRRSLPVDETLTITVTLSGEFASADPGNIPLKNLEVQGDPAVSTELTWINGAVSNRRVVRYTARPSAPGPALVGPVVIRGSTGQTETLAPVSVQVLPEEMVTGSDPATILRQLLAAGRPPSFIIARADRSRVYEGEQVIVTWTLYNAANVQRWQIESVPRLEDFWTEELDVKNEPQGQEYVAGMSMRTAVIRRVAVFPLRSGHFSIGGVRLSAQVLSRNDNSPFGFFEGSVSEVRVFSPATAIDVLPLPPGVPVDLVGQIQLECSQPAQKEGGPVTFGIGLYGRGNLRGAEAPRLGGPVDGESEVESLSFNVDKRRTDVVMRRRWRYVIFPAHSGAMQIPPLSVTVFNPAIGQRQMFQCRATTIDVQQVARGAAANTPASSTPPPPLPAAARWRALLPWGVGLVIAAVLAAVAIPLIRRAAGGRSVVRQLMSDPAPAAVRARVTQHLESRGVAVASVLKERSDRGDALRALWSLLDAVERERIPAGEARDELAERLGELLESLG